MILLESKCNIYKIKKKRMKDYTLVWSRNISTIIIQLAAYRICEED